MVSGSPPCSPQIPILSSGFTARARSHRDLHQFAHSFVQGDERIVLDDALVGILAQESAGIVATQPERVWVRSLVPKEKNSALLADLAGHETRAGSSIMVPT
jgi:hypothetical protein